MNNVGLVAVSDFCRNLADDEEIARLRADLDYREQELARRANKLTKSGAPLLFGGLVPSARGIIKF